MKRFVKTWMLWLLVFALPLQVQASVMQLSCEIGQAPGHQRQAANPAARAGHSSLAKQLPRLKKQGKALAKAGAASAMAEMDHTACGPCTACCGASATLPNLQATPAAWLNPDLHIALRPASLAGFIPEGLERPPRLHHS